MGFVDTFETFLLNIGFSGSNCRPRESSISSFSLSPSLSFNKNLIFFEDFENFSSYAKGIFEPHSFDDLLAFSFWDKIWFSFSFSSRGMF